MQAPEGFFNRGSGLLRQVRVALRRATPTFSRAGSYISTGMGVVFRWAWVASLATWVFVYPLLRGRQHQSQIDSVYHNFLTQRGEAPTESRASRYQHQ